MNHCSPFLKSFYTLFFFALGCTTIFAQPYPTPGNDYPDAPIITCLDGYIGTLGPVSYVRTFPGFCGDLQNAHWLAFVAESTDMTLSVDITNCSGSSNGGFGLQIGVLGVGATCTPSEFYAVTCFGSGNWLQRDFPMTGLDIGSVYYIVVDGYANDNCTYEFSLATPLTGPQAPTNPQLSGPSVVQEGSLTNYLLDLGVDEYIKHNPCGNDFLNCDGSPACDWEYTYTWSAPPGTIVIPGDPADQAVINWGSQGGDVCVTIENPCIGAPIVVCQTVTVVDLNDGPCDPGLPTDASDTCADAPFLCGSALHGFCGNTSGASADSPGDLASELSCPVDNNQWVRFTPCDTEVHFAIETFGCLLGNSLEISVVQTDDCTDFTSLLDCQLLPASFTSSFGVSNLVPGEVYYLMVDGVNGIGCDYQIFVLDGISLEAPSYQQQTAGFISGPDEVCPEESPVYTLTPPDCIPAFADGCPFPEELADSLRLVWHLPPSMSFVGDSVNVLSIQVTMTDTVDGAIYVTYETIAGDNVFCTFGIGDCNSVPAFPVTINYFITDLPTAFICEDETFNFCGQDYNQSQVLVCPEYCGETRQELVVLPLDTITLAVIELCEGECYDFCGTPYCGTQNTLLYCRQDCNVLAQEIIVHPKVINDFGVVDFCQGDCYDFLGQQFCNEGTFEIEIPGAFGCDETNRITLQYYTPPTLLSSTPTTDCEVNSNAYQISFDLLNGVAPFLVNGQMISGNSYTSDWIANGVSYDFQIVDSDFCPATLTIQGSFDCTSLCTTDAGTLQGINLSACGSESIEVAIGADAVIDFNDTYSYLLHDGTATSLGTILDSNVTGIFDYNPSLQYSQPYFISLIVGNGTDAVDTDDACHAISDGLEVVFYELPLASASAQGIITCTETEAFLSAGPAIPGTSYAWTGPNNFTSDLSELTTSIPGVYDLTVTSADGCSVVSQVTVEENRVAPILDAGMAGELNCTVEEWQIIGSLQAEGSNVDYFWETLSGNIIAGEDSLEPWVDAPGMYYLYAINRDNGCESLDSVLITRNENYPEAVDLGISHPNCFGEASGQVTVLAVNGGEAPYLYALDGAAFSTNPILSQLTPGTYELLVQDLNGCELSTPITINQPKELVVDLGEDLYVGLGDQVNLSALSNFAADSISWMDANGVLLEEGVTGLEYDFQAIENQMIEVWVAEESGCGASDRVQIFVDRRENVFIPNAFSPNGDGDNDFFTVFSDHSVNAVESMTIFSRWGEVLYEKRNFSPNDPTFGWDGTAGGKSLNDGVYVYKVALLLADGRMEVYAGDVVLVK